MTSGMMAAASGVLLASFLPFLLPADWLLIVGAILCLLLTISRWPLVGVAAFFVGGLFWGSLHGFQLLQQLLPEHLEKEELWVEGIISGLPETRQTHGKTQFRFDLQVHRAGCFPEHLECPLQLEKLRLTQYGGEPPRVGERWRFSVRLRRPRGLANPAGFHYGAWLVGNGFHAVGYVTDEQPARRLAPAPAWRGGRARLSERLRERLQGFEHGNILLALAVGDRSGLSQEEWRRYRQTGTIHLMAISGLHIGIVVGIGLLLGRGLVRLFSPVGWRWPLAYLVVGLLTGVAYSYLAGFGLPTRRALLMCALAMAGMALHRRFSLWWLWSAALLLVLLVDPLSGYSQGFWLSFAAVAVLILGLNGRSGAHRQVSWRPQWVIFVGLLPVLAFLTSEFSLLSLPANLIAVPLFSLCIVPLNLLAVLLLPLSTSAAGWLWSVCDALIGVLDRYLGLLSEQSWGIWSLPQGVPVPLSALAVAGVLVCLLPRGWPGRWLGPVLILPMLCWRPEPPVDHGQLQLTVLDVGQGLAVVLRTRHHSLVYDLGPRHSDRFNTAEAVVLPFLKGQGIREVDTLIISHADNDHAGAAGKFVEAIRVHRTLAGESLPGLSPDKPCRAGQRWQWDGVAFEVLHPQAGRSYRKSNNRSCVLRVVAGSHSVLLTGDIERRVEHALLMPLRARGQETTLLIAPHHGSGTSSGPSFVYTVAPQQVVFSAGYKHHFGHPKPEVVERYRRKGVRIWQTARDGALEFVLGQSGEPMVYAWRHNHRYYWQ